MGRDLAGNAEFAGCLLKEVVGPVALVEFEAMGNVRKAHWSRRGKARADVSILCGFAL
jgi:hypothetical protein